MCIFGGSEGKASGRPSSTTMNMLTLGLLLAQQGQDRRQATHDLKIEQDEPELAKDIQAAQRQSAKTVENRVSGRKGIQQHITTSALGLTQPANISRKSLLGQ